MAWWHRQQDRVLDAGIDGWKLDFGESYVRVPTVRTAAGPKPHQEYSEKYYEDFLAYAGRIPGFRDKKDRAAHAASAWRRAHRLV
jgi:alpha-glucosidase (family GH31 glycosyl hydrolase)